MANNIKIAVTGDFCPIYENGDLIMNDLYDKAFGNLIDNIKDKDLHITNLECPLTNSEAPILKLGPSLKADPTLIKGLKHTLVDIACLANNHISDYGDQGVIDSIELCHSNGIKTVGGGKNIKDASTTLFVSVKGKSIAIINVAEHEFTIASEERAGANPLDIIQNFHAIKDARSKADIVILIIHGGNEYYQLPSPRVVEMYRFLAEAGADVVIGHHPHVYSGYELYKGVPIFYSIGNFFFGWDVIRPDNEYIGLLLLLDFDEKGSLTFEIKPFYQSKPGIGFKVMEGEEKQKILDHVAQLSSIISDKKKLEKEWQNFLNAKQVQYYNNMYGLNKITRRLVKVPVFKQFILSKRRNLMLLNMIDCEAHRDVTIELLKNQIKS